CWWQNPQKAIIINEDDFIQEGEGIYRAVLTITADEAPSLEAIATDKENNTIQNIILFVGVQEADVVYLDNITLYGNRKIVETPIEHADKGIAKLPSDFEDGTRQGWEWDPESGVKTALTIEEVNGSKALSWEYAYPEVKPSDGWASAPRLTLWMEDLVLGENEQIAFDLYIAPERATQGAIDINLIFQPPTLGYWRSEEHTSELQSRENL